MKRPRPETEPKTAIKPVHKAELSLFSPLYDQTSILKVKEEQFGPDGLITQDGPIFISIPPNEQMFSDMTNCYLTVKIQVLKSDDTKLTAADKENVYPTAAMFDSLFSRITVHLNNMPIGSENACHPQMAFLRNILNYNEDFRVGVLSTTIGLNEDMCDSDGTIIEPVWRHREIAKSKIITLVGRLQHNFFSCSRLLLPNVPIKIVLERTGPQMTLMRAKDVTDTYKIIIHRCSLTLNRVTVSQPSISLIENQLSRQASEYPYMNLVMRAFDISPGMTSWRARNLFGGDLPTRMFFAVTDPLSLQTSSWRNNPFLFPAAQCGISFVQFYINENPVLFPPYLPDFENGDAVESFTGLIKALRTFRTGQQYSGLGYRSFCGNLGIFGCDLSPDQSNLSPSGTGSISVEVHFKNATKEPLAGMLIAEYRSCVYIDKYRSVTQTALM